MKLGATKKIAMASVALVAALGVAAGSTFAWFTSNTTVTVSGFESQIVTGTESLTVAVVPLDTEDTLDGYTGEGITYGASLSNLQIKRVILGDNTLTDTDVNGVYLSALTPRDVSATGAASRYDGSAFKTENADETQPPIAPNSTVESQGSYVSFKLIFRNRANSTEEEAAHPRYITLSADSTVDRSSEAASVTYNSAQYSIVEGHLFGRTGENAEAGSLTYYGGETNLTASTPNQSLSAYAADAARVSFVRTAGTDTVGTVWSPNEYNLDGSQAEDTSVAGTNAVTTTSEEGNVVTSKARGYYLNNLASDFRMGTLGWTASDKVVSQQTYTDYVNPYSNNSEDARVSENLVVMQGDNDGLYTYTSVVVNIWLEGTDGDCFDAILKNAFSVKLKFNIVASASTEEETPGS